MTFPTWDMLGIDPDLLREYGYNETVVYGGYELPRFLAYMLAGINQAGLSITAAGTGFVGTSSTSTTIGTGSKSLTIEAGKGFVSGMTVVAWDATDPTRFIAGEVTSYNPGTGALVISVLAGDTGGTGTVTSWEVSIAGRRGVEGSIWLNGSGAPSDAAGRNGDYYLRTTTGEVFYKVAGTWGAAIADLTGPTGPTGATGPAGSGSTIHVADEGVQVTAAPRQQINFIGDHVTAVDNPGSNRVDVTVSGSPALPTLMLGQGIY
ncbi:MAG: hypothetical protein ACK53W_12580 [Gemmatimonadota bacterium]